MLMLSAMTLLWSCSSTKHVPDGKYLLNSVSIEVDDSDAAKTTELYNYLKQYPNHKVLGCMKIQLATYNLSGKDSTRWYNNWLRRL